MSLEADPTTGLNGMGVLITRSIEQARALEAAVIEHEGIPFVFPCLQIRLTRVEALTLQLAKIRPQDYIIFVSVNAVNGVFNDLSEPLKTQLSQARIAVVGQRTGQAIVEQGLVVDVLPSPDQQNSEGLLNCLSEFKLEGQTIFIARAQTGREYLKVELQKLGAQVEYISAYQTTLPEPYDTQQIVSALSTGKLKLVMISSYQIFINLIQMLGQSAISLLKDKVIIVPSERIAKRIFESHGLKATVADNASDEAMIQAMLCVCRA